MNKKLKIMMNNIKIKCKNEKGISLIVLVITIIIMIILFSAIILAMTSNSPIDSAREAKLRNDLQVIKERYQLAHSQAGIKYNGNIDLITKDDLKDVILEEYKPDFEALPEGPAYVGNDEIVENIAKEMGFLILNDNTLSIMKNWNSSSNDDFHNSKYKSKISKIIFKNNTDIPQDNIIEFWDISSKQNKSVISYIQNDNSGGYIVTIGGNKKIYANENSSQVFHRFTNLKEIENIELLDTSKVKNMNEMFSFCNSLLNLDLSSFNTSNVESMMGLFGGCSSLQSLNLSNWNTSNVTNMGSMFNGCKNIKNLDLSSFDVSNVKSMRFMFDLCSLLENLNINNWNFKQVTSMDLMFRSCYNVITQINITNNNAISYRNMFANSATSDNSKIIVNYTMETSDLVDKMIATKSPNSNVVKGNLI